MVESAGHQGWWPQRSYVNRARESTIIPSQREIFQISFRVLVSDYMKILHDFTPECTHVIYNVHVTYIIIYKYHAHEYILIYINCKIPWKLESLTPSQVILSDRWQLRAKVLTFLIFPSLRGRNRMGQKSPHPPSLGTPLLLPPQFFFLSSTLLLSRTVGSFLASLPLSK